MRLDWPQHALKVSVEISFARGTVSTVKGC